MKKINKRTATKWELYFYYVQLSIRIAKGFLIIPLYLTFINKQLYGAWLATGNVLGWIQLFDPGTGAILKQKIGYENGQNNKKNLGLYIGSGILISIIITIVVFLCGIILSNYLASLLNLNLDVITLKKLKRAFNLAVIGTSFSVFSFSIIAINKGFLQTKKSNIIILLSSTIGLGLNIILLFVGFGVLALGWSIIVTGFLTFSGNAILLIIIILQKKITININWLFFKNFSKLFSYTFFAKIGVVLVEKSDLIIISRFIGQETVTAFELTRRPMRIIFDLVNKGSVALMPAISNLSGANEIEKIRLVFKKFTNYLIWGITFIGIAFILFNKSLINLWLGDKQFYIGNTLNILLVFSFIIRSFFYNYSNISFSLGNIKGFSIILFFKSIIYIICTFFLIRKFELFGIILSLILATLATELWYYPLSLKKLLKINKIKLIKLTSIFYPFFILLIPIFINKFIFIDKWYVLSIYCCITTFIYVIIMYLSSYQFRKEFNAFYKKISMRLF